MQEGAQQSECVGVGAGEVKEAEHVFHLTTMSKDCLIDHMYALKGQVKENRLYSPIIDLAVPVGT